MNKWIFDITQSVLKLFFLFIELIDKSFPQKLLIATFIVGQIKLNRGRVYIAFFSSNIDISIDDLLADGVGLVLDVGLGDESGAGFGSVEEFLEVVLGLVGGLITLAHCDIILLPIIIFATLVELLIFLTSFWGYKNAYSFCGRKKDVFWRLGDLIQ